METSDGAPGQWYLHTFAPEQPDLNWADESVVRDFEDILRFWFDRGVDGLRVECAVLRPGGLGKAGTHGFEGFHGATFLQ